MQHLYTLPTCCTEYNSFAPQSITPKTMTRLVDFRMYVCPSVRASYTLNRNGNVLAGVQMEEIGQLPPPQNAFKRLKL